MTGMNWIRVIERERGQYPVVKVAYTPITCMQCEDAPCIKAARNKAVYRRPDGIVIIDPVKAKGQKQIVTACPYRVIEWNEEKQIPQKCTLCAHMLDKGEKVPRCVESCPTDALVFGDLDDPNSEVSKYVKKGAKGLEPKGGNIGPNSRYYGKKKDIDLLFRNYTPAAVADMNGIRRRAMMAAMVKPAMRKAQEMGLLGLAGAIALNKLNGENDNG